MKPRIAIPLPTSFDAEYNRLNWPTFAAAVSAAGGEPVEVPLQLDDQAISHLARGVHGILLPGSPADVDPDRYGQPRDPATAQADAARERTDLFLLEHAHHVRKPVLGVCFGTQMLNVYRGGTLEQDISILPVNHAASRSVRVAHTTDVAPGSLLGELLTLEEAGELLGALRLPVNSSHHQAVALVGEGLAVSSRCPQDATIESIEGVLPGHFVLGVQWHPERTTEESAASRAMFLRLVEEAALYRDRPI